MDFFRILVQLDARNFGGYPANAVEGCCWSLVLGHVISVVQASRSRTLAIFVLRCPLFVLRGEYGHGI